MDNSKPQVFAAITVRPSLPSGNLSEIWKLAMPGSQGKLLLSTVARWPKGDETIPCTSALATVQLSPIYFEPVIYQSPTRMQ